ncbi:serine/threonine protein phosphatase, partial [Streptomyces sp. SID2131]|nr:serine/threonine protein phosphatase [Streptomyces sp. SID2131]
MQGIATVVEGSMTQGAGQEPVVRTATLRDFRVPPYARVPVQSHAAEPSGPEPYSAPDEHPAAHGAPAPHSAPVERHAERHDERHAEHPTAHPGAHPAPAVRP